MRLNVEQQKIVELEPAGHMLVKGVAGSGKTSVAIRRLLFLQEHYCPNKDDKILFVTFTRTLIKYIEHQYEQLQEYSGQDQLGLFSQHVQSEIKTIDQLMYKFFAHYCKRHRFPYKIASNQESRMALQQTVLKLRETYGDIKMISLKNIDFLKDEIEWIKACHIPDLETYQQIDRIGRFNGGEGNPQKLTKNSRTREAIYRLMEMYDQYLRHSNLIDFKTMNLLALDEVESGNYEKYTHILIDECQDLSKVQLKFLTALHANKSYASIMFIADNTQSIYSQSWLGKGRPYTTIGYDMSGKARTLSKNYRTTTEISKAAYNLIEHDEQIKNNVDFVRPALIDRHGHPPIYRIFQNPKKQIDFLIDEIKQLQKHTRLGDICIITRYHKLIDQVAEQLEQAHIPCEKLAEQRPNFSGNTVKLTTMHSIKGLEFKVIFLLHLDHGVIPSDMHRIEDDTYDTEERKLLYVGMTRANELLYMTSVGKPSYFIKDIEKDHLRFGNGMDLRPLYQVFIQDYQFTDQIVDLNSKEELIRQWLINELRKNYGYPLELMELEFAVQRFSKRGYVDLVVMIERNGKQIPYIFAEVKSFGSGIDIGLEQLRSYMNANDDVLYGVVTDGVDLKVIDRNGEEVVDIPPCQPQFLPSVKHSRLYKNFRNLNTYQYVQQMEEEGHIDIVDPLSNLILDVDINCKIPLVGNVAAGIPKTAIEHFEDAIMLPQEWVIQQENTFALRVTGDSMVEAGIDKGDIVIVHKQNYAENGDIIIALIGEEATMKEFMLMGGTVLLISKNKNYEPIQMNPEDIVINGKIIGVLKE